MKTTVKVSTKVHDKAPKCTTDLTIDWDVTPEAIRELATKSVVIAVQRRWRDAEAIPKAETVKVSELEKRPPQVVVKALTPAEMLAAAKADPGYAKELADMLLAVEQLARDTPK